MRIHLVHPKVQWSLSDVFDGLAYGLTAHGVTIAPMEACDWIIVVNGNLHALDTLALWRSRYAHVAVLCTETPYDIDLELERAAVVDGVWTHERASLPSFAAVNARVQYLPHGWHPERHGHLSPDPSVPAHDILLVGSGFSERVEWVNRIDWTGIDLGLYGIWDGFGLEDSIVERHVKGWVIPNTQAVALYRRAKIGLNLYRTKPGIRKVIPRPDVTAESLNPRAYELAACGSFHLSTARSEVQEVFGDLVPIISGKAKDAQADEAVMRDWLVRDADRQRIAAALPACVVNDSWVSRAAQVLRDVQRWGQVAA